MCILLDVLCLDVQVSRDVPADVPGSQPDCFSADAWQAMLFDLEPHASQILERFCIREIIRLVSDHVTFTYFTGLPTHTVGGPD